MDRPFPNVRTAGERAQLCTLLDWYRAGVVAKASGLDDEAARRPLAGSTTTIAGVVNHLAFVEDWWFESGFAGRDWGEPWASMDFDADPDAEFHEALDRPIGELIGRYDAACARSRAVAGAAGLDDLSGGEREPFTLRYALVHLLEETARHLGHIDLLRELHDGTTGG